MGNLGRWMRGVALGAAMFVAAAGTSAQGLPKLLIIAADGTPPVAEMMATGQFSVVDSYIATGGTPTLAQLLNYDTILAYSNSPPANGSALGDVLADAVDAGRFVTLATYGLSQPWAITGRIQTAGYSPLITASNGDVGTSLTAVVPGDPIFSGVTLASVAYFENSNFAHPTLAAGAQLLATDGGGINMIARNATGRVTAINLFPASGYGNNAEFYKLIANIVSNNAVPIVVAPLEVPTMSEWALFATMLLVAGVAGLSLRRRVH